jgi:hypothetical protein
MSFPASPADGQTTLINGVTYIYSLANVSWSPYASNSTVAYTSIAVSGNANITGTTTSGTEIVTGNETVGGNSNVTGILTAGSIVSSSLIKRVGNAGAVDLNASTYYIGSQIVGFDVATNKPGSSYGVLINIQERGDTAGQLVIDYDTGNLYSRGIYTPGSVSTGTPSYSSWKTMLHSGNYTTYSPSLTGTGASGTWGIGISGNAGTVSSITANTGLLVNNLYAPGVSANNLIDGMTSSNFRQAMFGTTSYGFALSASRWNTVPTPLTGLASYGTSIAWSGADTHGFLAVNYSAQGAIIGGGNAQTINWSATLLHSTNYTSYALALSGQPNNGDNYVNFRVMRNSSTASNNDGMYIGYGNTNSGVTRLFGGGSTTNYAAMSSADFSPNATNTIDLGTSSLRWRNVYTNDLNLSNGIGDYTIVEGEDDLFLYNNKKGKVYKFALIEVDPKDATPKIDELK